MSTPHTPATPTTFNPAAGVASLILPGAGHLILGEPRRALAIAIGILGLFFGGIFIGGIDVIDSREDRLWFIGQAIVGPVAFAVDYAHQSGFKGYEIQPEITVNGKISARQLAESPPRSAYPGERREVITLQVVDPATGASSAARLPVLRRLTADEFSSAGLSRELADRYPLQLTPAELAALDAKGLGPPNRKSLSKANELGTLFSTIAGMLNIIVILDAFFPPIARAGRRDADSIVGALASGATGAATP